jgi:hypothetical protein
MARTPASVNRATRPAALLAWALIAVLALAGTTGGAPAANELAQNPFVRIAAFAFAGVYAVRQMRRRSVSAQRETLEQNDTGLKENDHA